MISLKIKGKGLKEDSLNGILLSFFSAVEEILRKERKASYLIHFFQERLGKSERKELLFLLDQIELQLQKNVEGKTTIRASESFSEIPKDFQDVLRKFQRIAGVSKGAKPSRQGSEADPTPFLPSNEGGR